MIQSVWTILCEQVLTSPKAGALSYINTLNSLPIKQINEESGEVTLAPFAISTKWFNDEKGSSADVKMRLSIKHESLDPKIIGEHDFTMGKEIMFAEFQMDISRMGVSKEGLYYLIVEYKVDKQRKWRLANLVPILIDSKKSIKQDEEQEFTLPKSEEK